MTNYASWVTCSGPRARTSWSPLDALEAEALHILREVAAECRNPAILFSGGKDSLVVVHLARKALHPEPLTIPLLHIDTGHNFPEVIAFRDRIAAEWDLKLHVRSVGESIRRGRIRLSYPGEPLNPHQSVTLLDAIAELQLDACIGGARRDEDKARAKERIFSFRDALGRWDPRNQRPELWALYNARVNKGEHIRVFPLSNWTELDIWQYIQREALPVPSLYFAHQRAVVRNGPLLAPVTEVTPAQDGDTIEHLRVRFRTLGDITCTAAVESNAATLAEIVMETAQARITERGATRLDDRLSDTAMEQRKREGYF